MHLLGQEVSTLLWGVTPAPMRAAWDTAPASAGTAWASCLLHSHSATHTWLQSAVDFEMYFGIALEGKGLANSVHFISKLFPAHTCSCCEMTITVPCGGCFGLGAQVWFVMWLLYSDYCSERTGRILISPQQLCVCRGTRHHGEARAGPYLCWHYRW